ncbi:MAG TPA: RidA family protein [Blastocatellia bacterium]|nr:RidA family protein [Blastocatellia bacterium]
MIQSALAVSLIVLLSLMTPERKVIVPANAARPVGPYSPGVLVGDYLYVSGQGVRDANGAMPEGIAAQTRQCLENVRAIVEAAGLTMQPVVHMQLYLERMSDLGEVDRVYATYFPSAPPARVVAGVAKMPTDTTVEMTAVAVRDLKMKRVLSLKNFKPVGHASPAVAAGNRVYLSAVYGRTVAEADQNLKRALEAARLSERQILFRNDYGTTPAATIPMRELPDQMQAAISVFAAKKTTENKNQSAVCRADGKTIFCAVQSGARDGGKTVRDQVKQAMQKLLAGLEKHGANLSHVTASNVYLDDIREFRPMNETYATFFSGAPPTRTTVQPFPAADRAEGNPALVRISVVAVKE